MTRLAAVLLPLLLLSAPALAEPPPPPAGSAAEKPADLTPQGIREMSLDDLFARLAERAGSRTGRALEAEIQRRFHESGSPTADLLFGWAMKAVEAKNNRLALDLLDQVILVKPDFAEAWNKRATVNYMLDDYSGSLSDIRQALLLEPRHFGALAGLGIILEASGRKTEAIAVLRRALEINPQLDKVRETLERLEKETAGQAI